MKLSEWDLHEKLVKKFISSMDERRSKEKCWNWTGPLQNNGYARLAHGSSKGPNFYVISGHRYSYLMHIGKTIPKGMVIMHTCDNKKCVNPFHLQLGTQMDNIKDKIAKGRASEGVNHAIATRLKTPRGSENAAAKLTESDIAGILELRRQGKTHREIAEEFNISKTGASNILSGISWSHISGIPKKELRFKELEER